jgi:hypothetical protein
VLPTAVAAEVTDEIQNSKAYTSSTFTSTITEHNTGATKKCLALNAVTNTRDSQLHIFICNVQQLNLLMLTKYMTKHHFHKTQ